MGKFVNDNVMDAAFDSISDGTTLQLHLCATQPTTRTEAVTTNNLGSTTLAGGDFTKANGDTSGRKQTIGAKTGISITSTGTCDHVAVTDSVDLLLVTTCTSQALTSGGTGDTIAFDHEIADAA